MNVNLTIPIQSSFLELLKSLGEPAAIVPAALRRYTMDSCLQRIENIEGKIALYVNRYGMDYATFNRRVTTDQVYLDNLNRECPLWEADAIEWAHRTEEAEAWRDRLNIALQTSLPSLVSG